MSDCARFEEDLRDLVAGDVGPDARALVEHADRCPSCRQLLSAHEALREIAAELRAVEIPDLGPLRGRVLERVRHEQASSPPRTFLGGGVLRPVALALSALSLFGVGFAAGWLRQDARSPAPPTLLTEMTDEAVSNESLDDVENSPFTYSDVRFRRLDEDLVSLEFDVTRHVRVTESARSPLVQEVLAQSLLYPTQTGSRLKALSLAAPGMSPKVRESLIFALHHDESLAVRQKALAILAAGPKDAAIEAAVLATLAEDEAVPMRLAALDYLAVHVEAATIRRAIGGRTAPGNAALLVRLGEHDNRDR